MTTNEWYKATKHRDSYRLNVVWDLLENPNGEQIYIQNPAQKLDHAKKGIVWERFYEIPAGAILKIHQGNLGE